jgi:hypothetical protein
VQKSQKIQDERSPRLELLYSLVEVERMIDDNFGLQNQKQ